MAAGQERTHLKNSPRCPFRHKSPISGAVSTVRRAALPYLQTFAEAHRLGQSGRSREQTPRGAAARRGADGLLRRAPARRRQTRRVGGKRAARAAGGGGNMAASAVADRSPPCRRNSPLGCRTQLSNQYGRRRFDIKMAKVCRYATFRARLVSTRRVNCDILLFLRVNMKLLLICCVFKRAQHARNYL